MSLSKPTSPHRLVLWPALKALPGATWALFRESYKRCLLVLSIGLAGSFGLSIFEKSIQESYLVVAPGTAWHILAEYASWWGKLENGLAVLILGWLALAVAGKRLRDQVAVLALLWGQVVAGVLVNLGKSGLGRARPNRGVEDGFYGPTTDYIYQSFPSGHTTAAFALGVTFAVLRPRWWPLAILYASLVGWSRMALHVHHPSDVLMGAFLGSLCGWLCGKAGRQVEDRLIPI